LQWKFRTPICRGEVGSIGPCPLRKYTVTFKGIPHLGFTLGRSRIRIDEGRPLRNLCWYFSLELLQSLNFSGSDMLHIFHDFLVPSIPLAPCSCSPLLKLVHAAGNWQAHWNVTVGK
jgi:hypothetical protein